MYDRDYFRNVLKVKSQFSFRGNRRSRQSRRLSPIRTLARFKPQTSPDGQKMSSSNVTSLSIQVSHTFRKTKKDSERSLKSHSKTRTETGSDWEPEHFSTRNETQVELTNDWPKTSGIVGLKSPLWRPVNPKPPPASGRPPGDYQKPPPKPPPNPPKPPPKPPKPPPPNSPPKPRPPVPPLPASVVPVAKLNTLTSVIPEN